MGNNVSSTAVEAPSGGEPTGDSSGVDAESSGLSTRTKVIIGCGVVAAIGATVLLIYYTVILGLYWLDSGIDHLVMVRSSP